MIPSRSRNGGWQWSGLWQVAAVALSAGTLAAGDLGHAIVETASGERIEGAVTIDKTGLRVTDGAGAVREIAPEDLRVARLVRGANARTAPATERGLRGTYFKTKELAGDAQTRIDERIDFAWGWEAPMPGFEPERFSVRWDGFIESLEGGNYPFHILSNDGARLWIDGRIVIDAWRDQSDTEHSGTIALEARTRYPIRMEMYEQGGTATARLFWTPPGGQREIVPAERFTQPDGNVPPSPVPMLADREQGLRGRYFRSANLDGESVERLDPEINFNWGRGHPGVGGNIGENNFSVRWEGWLEGPVTGKVHFFTRSDDGVRLWVDDRPLIDQWRAMSATEHRGEIDLKQGKKYPIRLEYYEASEEATVTLSWEAQGMGKQIIPSRSLNPGRTDGTTPTPVARLLLRGGSVLTGQILSADKRTVTLAIPDGKIDVPVRGIALMQFGDLPEDRLNDLLAGNPGCLTRDRDFLEAEFLGYDDGRLRFSSILFGLKSIPIGPTLAIVLGNRKVRESPFSVATSGQGLLLALDLSVEGHHLHLLDNSFSRLTLPLATLTEIRGGAY